MAHRVNLTALAIGLGVAFGIAPKAIAQGSSDNGTATGANAANADDYFRRDHNTSVAQRRKHHDDGLGWRVGSFIVKPELDLRAGYSDNYAAAEVNPKGSAVYEAEARVDVASDWGRHSLHASIDIPTTVYSSHFSATDYLLDVGGRFDVDRSLGIVGGAGYGNRSEPLGFTDTTTLSLRDPLQYDTVNGYVGFDKRFNRLRVAGRVDYATSNYRKGTLTNGTVISFDERDVSTTQYGLRADYAVSETTAIFASATANHRDHKLDLPVNQDSMGAEYLVGVNFDITHLMRGEIAVGALTQTFDEPGVRDETGLAARGQVEWFPDPLLTVTLGAQRSVHDSYTTEAATFVGTDANLAVDYEFRRNINLGVSAGYSTGDYDQIDRNDRRWDVHAAAEWAINRTLSLSVSGGHTAQTSEGADAGRTYDANDVLIGLRLRR